MATNPQDVLSLFQKGASKKQIADSLKISREKVAELLSIAIRNAKKG
jgi:DNA-binding CsgD family transcriptional regulator